MAICRAVFLKPTEFRELAQPLAVLLGMTSLLVFGGLRLFKTDVEP